MPSKRTNAQPTIKQTLNDDTIDRRDAEWLLAHILKKDRSVLLAHSSTAVTPRQRKQLARLVNRRKKGEPLAYLLQSQPFFGHDFFVNKNVLIPRPETEYLVAYGIKTLAEHPEIRTIIDVGTGSGAILISVVKSIKITRAIGIDSSSQALTVARRNGRGLNIAWKKGNLLSNSIISGPSLVLANLPYLTTKDYQETSAEVRTYEPKQALVAGADGLKYYRPLLKQLAKVEVPFFACFEIDPCHDKKIKHLASTLLPSHRARLEKDYRGKNRYLILEPN